MTVFPTLCGMAVGVLLIAEAQHNAPLKAGSKTIAAAAFIAHAWYEGALSQGTPGLWVLVGLVFCMGGDLFLLSREKKWFLAGLVSFLIGHVCYVGAFVSLGLSAVGLGVGALLVSVAAAGIWQWLGSKVDDGMRKPVMAYIAVISSMVACSIGALAAAPDAARILLLVAAVLFFLSDICVARDRFVSPGFNNRLVGLPLYFAAQILFGSGVTSLGG